LLVKVDISFVWGYKGKEKMRFLEEGKMGNELISKLENVDVPARYVVEDDPENYLTRLPDLAEKRVVVYGVSGTNGDPLLEKIMGAVGVHMEEVWVCDELESIIPLKYLERTESIQYCLLFGVKSSDIQLLADLTPYAPTEVGSILVVESAALGMLEKDQRLKGALWSGLKKAFAIN
jgi:hypothetical protein